MPIRALSFDLFDTLVDLHLDGLPEFEAEGRRQRGTQPLLFELLPERSGIDFPTFRTQLAAVDLELRADWAAKGRELPTLLRFRALCERLELRDPGLPERLTELHMGTLQTCARTPAHHAHILAELKRDYPIALCSNFSHAETARRILAQAGLAEHFDQLLISEEVGFRKPDGRMFQAVADALGIPPSEILHVGDRFVADVLGAARAGFRSAWLTRRVSPSHRSEHLEQDSPADLILSDLGELPDRIQLILRA